MKAQTNLFRRRAVRSLRFSMLTLIALFLSCTGEQPSSNAPSTDSGQTSPQQSLLDVKAIEQMVGDPQASRKAYEEDKGAYAWQLFVYLNSPLTGTGQKRWETDYRQTSTIYLPTGCEPPPWGQTSPPAEVVAQAKNLPNWVDPIQVWHNLDTRIQVDGLVLLDTWKQDVRYQLLMNKPAFDYIIERGFYNVDGQEKAARDGKPADFPATSFELKTSWIWIGTDADKFNQLKPSYYIAPAYFEVVENGKHIRWEAGYAALSGMHIINRSRPNWVWITFENVDNAKFTEAKLELPIPDYAAQANQVFQQALRGMGSIFANYQLDGVQLDFQDPTLLANSNIESAFQSQSSCITCHALASIKPNGAYFNIVDRQGGNIGYYTGTPPSTTGYTSLDFVWSMKRASRKTNCP
ncbi:MAG: hypothetical protein L0229_11550 [Blastocatellia bacterium]|nr:hypothetical protein [Blastocatellia bacterium]